MGRDLRAIGIVWLILLGLYLPVLFSGRVLVDDPALVDVSFLNLPNLSWMAASWRTGEFPLWNPHTHCGMPHLGYSHSGGLYPVRVILFTLLPYILANSLSIIFHGLVASALFFLLLRRSGIERLFAGAGGLIFALSGMFFGMMYVTWMLGSMCGFFAAWLFMDRQLARPGWGGFIGTALAVAWCGLAGDVELLTYGLMALFVLFLLRTGPAPGKLLRLAALFGAPVIAGFLIMSPMALSTLETVHFSIRGPTMPFELKIISLGIKWQHLIPTMLFPFRYYRNLMPTSAFNSGLPPLYQGFLVNGLVLWGLAASWRDRRLRPLALSWLFLFLFIIAGEAEAAAVILDRIPVLGSLRFSGKALLFTQAFGLMLGFKVLSARAGAGEERISILGIILLGSGAAMVLAQPWCMGGPERYVIGALAAALGAAHLLRGRGRPLVSASQAARLATALLVIEALALAWRNVPRTDPERFELAPELLRLARTLTPDTRFAVFEQLLSEAPDAPAPLFGLFETASGAGNIVGASRIMPARVFMYLAQIYNQLIYVDPRGVKFLAGWNITNPGSLERGRLHLFNLAGPRLLLSRGLAVPYASPYWTMRPGCLPWKASGTGIERDPKTGAIRMSRPARLAAALASLPGDRLDLSGSASGPGWIMVIAREKPGLSLARFVEEGGVSLQAGLNAFQDGGVMGLSWTPGRDGSGLSITGLAITNPSRPFQEMGEFGEVQAFENRQALPRAFIVHKSVVIKNFMDILKWIDDPGKFSPLHEAVVEEESPEARIVEKGPPLAPRLASMEGARIVSYGPHRVEMQARLYAPGFLVFTDAYFPGWRAEVIAEGARETRIFPADLCFRAVFLDQGESRIIFTYRPLPFRLGLWAGVSSLAFALLYLAGLVPARTRLRGRNKDMQDVKDKKILS
jgi:hypothetical protein